MRFFDRYTGFWRRWKLFYVFYNLLKISKLAYLKPAFRKYGIKRPVYFPLHSKHFEKLPQALEQNTDPEWDLKGYSILKAVLSSDEVDQINADMEAALAQKEIGFNYTGRKIHFAYEKVERVKALMRHPKLMAALQERMGSEVVPFQSINFHYGSEQQAHSDSIHMSTYPKGGLIAAWIALDDTTDDNGPLFYFPGSHKWPYVTNRDIGASTSWLLSPNPNKLYEEYIGRKLEATQPSKEVFYAQKGDVLIWHANLLHGGMQHKDMSQTRRSMVVHYFRKGDICYHEISQRPAIISEL